MILHYLLITAALCGIEFTLVKVKEKAYELHSRQKS